jgi:curved DNA-binding protein CbpA
MECWRVNWKDYYDILGVRINSEPEVIKGAYNAMAKKFHPDRNPSGADRMTQVNEAYEVLSDPLKKADYDVAYRDRWQSRYGRGRQESGSSSGNAQRESTDNSESSGPNPGPQQDSTDSGDRRGESAGARQENSTGSSGEQSGSGADPGPGPSAASPPGETPREEARRPERSGPGVWQRAASACWSLYDHFSMRPPYQDYHEKFIPWPSLGWQQAALIGSIPLGLILAIKAPLFWFQVGGGAFFLAGSYACIATHCIRYVDKANAAARFLGTVVVIVMLLAIGATMLALALGLIVAVIAALVIWSLGSRAMKKD